jgi:hypothetical protein
MTSKNPPMISYAAFVYISATKGALPSLLWLLWLLCWSLAHSMALTMANTIEKIARTEVTCIRDAASTTVVCSSGHTQVTKRLGERLDKQAVVVLVA